MNECVPLVLPVMVMLLLFIVSVSISFENWILMFEFVAIPVPPLSGTVYTTTGFSVSTVWVLKTITFGMSESPLLPRTRFVRKPQPSRRL